MIGFVYIIVAHLLGQYYFYFTYQYYDKFLHLTIPAILTLMIWGWNKKCKLYLVWLATVGIIGLTEIFEYLIDVFGNPTYAWQGVSSIINGAMVMTPHVDTMIDMIIGSVSSLMIVLILWKVSNQRLKHVGL